MDKHGLGRERERQVMQQYYDCGFVCWQPARAKYANQDIFGIFDFVAISPHGFVYFVQVCHPNSIKAKQAAIQNFMAQWSERECWRAALYAASEKGIVYVKGWP